MNDHGTMMMRSGLNDSEFVLSGLTSPRFWGKLPKASKDEKDFPNQYERKMQKPASVMVRGCIMAKVQTGKLKRLPSRQRQWILQQVNVRSHSAHARTAWLHRHRVCALDWPACSPDWSPTENVWHITKQRIRQWRPRATEQRKSLIQQEWAKIPLTKMQQLVNLVPK